MTEKSKAKGSFIDMIVSMGWPSGFAAFALAVLLTMAAVDEHLTAHYVCTVSSAFLLIYATNASFDVQLFRASGSRKVEIITRLGMNLVFCSLMCLVSITALLWSISILIAVVICALAMILLSVQLSRFQALATLKRDQTISVLMIWYGIQLFCLLVVLVIAGYYDWTKWLMK